MSNAMVDSAANQDEDVTDAASDAARSMAAEAMLALNDWIGVLQTALSAGLNAESVKILLDAGVSDEMMYVSSLRNS